jgi:ammonium transporter, Amt family
MDDHSNSSCAAHDSRRRVCFDCSSGVCEKVVKVLIPCNSFFYSGLARRKSALSLLWLSVMATAVISFQWFFWGYSLTFSHTASKYIGNLDNIGFRDVLAYPSVGSTKIPDLLFAVYQGMFAAITYVSPLHRP